jgi:hypothetical protein
MSNVARRYWLAVALLVCSVPSSLALQKFSEEPRHDTCKPGHKCKQQVPEGGTAALYLPLQAHVCPSE